MYLLLKICKHKLRIWDTDVFLSLTDYSRKTDLRQSHKSGFRIQVFKQIKPIALKYLQEDTYSWEQTIKSLPLPVYTEHILTHPWFSHTACIHC